MYRRRGRHPRHYSPESDSDFGSEWDSDSSYGSPPPRRSSKSREDDTENDESTKARINYEEGPTKTGVRHCSWSEFMNVFSTDEQAYAIEVLLADAAWAKERSKETIIRLRHGVKTVAEKKKGLVSRSQEASQKQVQQVRIRSTELLNAFANASGYEWGSQHPTFPSPFKYLVHFHDAFEAELGRLVSEDKSDEESIKTRSDLKCYLEFAKEYIIPRARMLRQATADETLRVRFSEMWYLFRPGDLIYIPTRTIKRRIRSAIESLNLEGEFGISHESSMYQAIWKLTSLRQSADRCFAQCYYLDYNGTQHHAKPWTFEMRPFEGERQIEQLDYYPLRLHPKREELLRAGEALGQKFNDCLRNWHLSYNGWSYVTDPIGVPIPDNDHSYRRAERPQFFQGEVLVCFKESFNHHPNYISAQRNFWSRPVSRANSRAVRSRDPLLIWRDAERSEVVARVDQYLWPFGDIDEIEYRDFLESDAYANLEMGGPLRPVPRGQDLALLPPRLFVFVLNERRFVPVDLRLIRPVTFVDNAFDFLKLPDRDKKIIEGAVHAHLRRHEIDLMIQQGGGEDQIRSQDFIRGKGRGLVIMLHGEPGIGKTATAEAVAQVIRRPLFTVSCGSLSNSYGVEKALDDVFHQAHIWSCVLLLDEADVFLSARSAASPYQAELVSIFLRKIEYFNGILFLTTNRIGKLDQAISSRMHIILHYKRLGPEQVRDIFRSNMLRLQATERQQHQATATTDKQPPSPELFVVESDVLRFATDHCARHPRGKGMWNGRQIRNAFVVAAALARHEARAVAESQSSSSEAAAANDNDATATAAAAAAARDGSTATATATAAVFQPQLRYHHFQEVERLNTEYNRFRAHVLGGDDSRKARLNEERDDDWYDAHELEAREEERYEAALAAEAGGFLGGGGGGGGAALSGGVRGDLGGGGMGGGGMGGGRDRGARATTPAAMYSLGRPGQVQGHYAAAHHGVVGGGGILSGASSASPVGGVSAHNNRVNAHAAGAGPRSPTGAWRGLVRSPQGGAMTSSGVDAAAMAHVVQQQQQQQQQGHAPPPAYGLFDPTQQYTERGYSPAPPLHRPGGSVSSGSGFQILSSPGSSSALLAPTPQHGRQQQHQSSGSVSDIQGDWDQWSVEDGRLSDRAPRR